MMKVPSFVSIDVESIGLHGEAYAVGWVRFYDGAECASGVIACPPSAASGDADSRAWVAENCPALVTKYVTTREVRDAFWFLWMQWRADGCLLVADCAWPVEARFLAACVADLPDARTWTGPYPLHDVATARLMAGFSPLADACRYPEEMPKHDPVADARQSGRLFAEAWGYCVPEYRR